MASGRKDGGQGQCQLIFPTLQSYIDACPLKSFANPIRYVLIWILSTNEILNERFELLRKNGQVAGYMPCSTHENTLIINNERGNQFFSQLHQLLPKFHQKKPPCLMHVLAESHLIPDVMIC